MKLEYPSIIYEDNHLIALNKPIGWLVQSDITGDMTLLDYGKKYIKERYNKPGAVFLNPVHRIDRPASGLVLMCRTSKSLGRMNKLIQERKIKKTYYAISNRNPTITSGELEHYIVKDSRKNKVKAIPVDRKKIPNKAKKASLNFKLIAEIEGDYLFEVDLYTGRPHQIRAQLAAIGCPLKGDLKYGANQGLESMGIALHSAKMEFIHPVKKEPITIEAKTPNTHMWTKFKGFI